jgi:hypothetical protein
MEIRRRVNLFLPRKTSSSSDGNEKQIIPIKKPNTSNFNGKVTSLQSSKLGKTFKGIKLV